MKKFTRFISIILTLAMILTILPTYVFAADKQAFTDVTGSEYYSAAAKALAELDILEGYEDGSFGGSLYITRAEMSAVICRMIDKEAEAEQAKGRTVFDDVNPYHWAIGYINIASDNKIINGDGDGNFRPEDNVTYEEAIKMVVCAVGLGDSITVTDPVDWSANYISAAKNNNITDGLRGVKGTASTRGDIAQMVYNGLTYNLTPVASVKGGSYTATQNVTLTSSVKDAEIYYTTDGSLPTTKSTKYTKAIAVSKTTTLKAIAVVKGVLVSDIMSEEYTFTISFGSGGGGGGTISSSSYTVSFDLNYDGATGAPASQRVSKNSTATEPENPTRDGYIFLGWSTNKDGEVLFDFSSTITRSTVLYAIWLNVGGSDSFSVTFLLNDGSPGAYEMQTVPANGYAAKPVDPELEYYQFTGWYTEPSTINKFDFTTKITGDTMLYAGWGSPYGNSDSELYVASSGTETIYSISGMEISNGNAYVTINVNSQSVLSVRFLDENDESLIDMAAVYTPEYCEMASIEVPLPSDLPEHFIAEVQLVSDDNEPLCESVKFVEFTTKYEEFEKLTVDDFAGQYVINYDEDESNNFGVLAPETKVIESTEVNNIVSVEKDLNDPSGTQVYYSIENPTNDLKSLNIGDSVYFSGTDYMFKIGAIEEENGKIIIIAVDDVAMEDFYDVIKVDMDISTEDQPNEIVETGEDEASLDVEIIDVDGDWSTDIGVSLDYAINDNVKISGNVKGKATVSVKMVYDAHLFSDDYFYCSFTTKSEFDVTAQLTASIDDSQNNSHTFETRKISVPTPIPGLDVYVQPSIPVNWEISGSGKLTFKFTQTSGFTYDTYSGHQKVDKKNYSLSLGLEGKAEVSFGPKIKVGVGWGKNITNDKYIVDANLSGQFGIKFTATVAADGTITNEESKHACTLCLNGEAKWFVTVDAKLEFYITKKLSATPIDWNLFSYETWLDILNIIDEGKFYVSLVNEQDSIFEGHVKLGGGECPNKAYRTTIVSQNANGDNISSNVSITKQNGKSVGSGNTTFDKFLYDGVYNVSGNVDGSYITKSFVVDGYAQTIELNANTANGVLKGAVKNADNNEVISDADVLVKHNDMVVASTKTDGTGNYTISIADGTYLVEITKNGYIPFSTVAEVANGAETYIATSLMVGNSGEKGGFSGKILDATNNNPISGVQLTLRKGWNNSSEGDVILSLTTDDNGEFKYEVKEFLGLKIGLTPGNYTLTATKLGYTTKSFDIIVLPGITKSDQNASLSPTMSEGSYRIVLKWGSDPRDLDSHLVGPTGAGSKFHTWYGDKSYSNSSGRVADLDLDDIDGYGPETTTIRQVFDGTYNFYVHHYAGNGTIASSGASVEVYRGDTKIATYYAPMDGGSGLYWNVFTLNGATGEIRPGNTITDSPISSASLYAGDNGEFDESLTMIADDVEKSVK